MTELALSADTLATLKRKHIAFLETRLSGDAARADWIASFRQGYEWALTQRVRELLKPDALTDGVLRALSSESVQTLFSPVARELSRRAFASLKSDASTVGDYVPEAARTAIQELLDKPDLVPPRLIRKVFEQEAIEEAIRDTLYDGLKEFNEGVNPFFADWGLPALIKRMPIGGSTIIKSMGAMRGEFDKRLEPEIRKFLLVFSRKAKVKLAEFFITKSGEPKFVELRKNLASYLYGESIKDLVAGVDNTTRASAERAAEQIALDARSRDRVRLRVRALLDELLRDAGDATLGDWLTAVGATGKPELDAFAELMWPHVALALESPVSRAFFAKITEEFYDGLASETI
jgi:hypothetical protein